MLNEKAFEEMGITKLNCEVLETNPSVIKLHKKFGFVEEGIRRKNIIKNNARVDVHLLGLLKDEWSKVKPRMQKVVERIMR
jgi:RimJ/RimL family protein N-acetyltransferase